MTYLVETHAHLDDHKFDADRDDVIERAIEAGVKQIVTVGVNLRSSRVAVAIAERYPSVYATVGVQPHDAESVGPSVLQELRDLALHPQVIAIGEIGLDFYRDLAPRDAQCAAFEAQLKLATETDKPVVIHIRDKKGEIGAYDEVLTILRTWLSNHPTVQSPNHPTTQPPGSPPGVLHCFSGDLSIAQVALDLGFYLGVDGPVTYSNAKGLQSMIAQLPLDRLLLETDCPYLTPQPQRGPRNKPSPRNEPAYLPYIVQKVAELKDVQVSYVARTTTANAERLFRLVGR